MSWDPAQYLKYANERLRPALDLLARVPIEAPRTIVDLGCGAGNVTQLLADALAARAHRRRRQFDRDAGGGAGVDRRRDAARMDRRRSRDLGAGRRRSMSSSATRRCIGTTTMRRSFPRIFGWVAPGGVLAVQMPDQFAAPSHVALAAVVSLRALARSARRRCCGDRRSRRPPAISGCLPRRRRGGRVDDGISACAAAGARRRASGRRLDEGHRADAVPRGARCRRAAGVPRRRIPRASPRPIRRLPTGACCSRSGACSSSRRERCGKATRPIRAARAGYERAAVAV